MDNYFDNTLNINELPKIKNGRIWYAAILPLLACYLENFVVNIILGAVLLDFCNNNLSVSLHIR